MKDIFSLNEKDIIHKQIDVWKNCMVSVNELARGAFKIAYLLEKPLNTEEKYVIKCPIDGAEGRNYFDNIKDCLMECRTYLIADFITNLFMKEIE